MGVRSGKSAACSRQTVLTTANCKLQTAHCTLGTLLSQFRSLYTFTVKMDVFTGQHPMSLPIILEEPFDCPSTGRMPGGEAPGYSLLFYVPTA